MTILLEGVRSHKDRKKEILEMKIEISEWKQKSRKIWGIPASVINSLVRRKKEIIFSKTVTRKLLRLRWNKSYLFASSIRKAEKGRLLVGKSLALLTVRSLTSNRMIAHTNADSWMKSGQCIALAFTRNVLGPTEVKMTPAIQASLIETRLGLHSLRLSTLM